MGLNSVYLEGNLGRDPEVRYLPSGTGMANFSIAVSRRYQKNGEWQTETSWVNLVAFGKTAENIGKLLTKGDRIVINGRLQSNEWEDKETGKKRSMLKVLVDNFSKIPKAEKKEASHAPGEDVPPQGGGDDDDIPI